MRLKGITVLVTGASRGIGRELVEQLLDQGVSRLIAVAREKEPLARLQREFGERVEPFAADLGKESDVFALIAHVTKSAPETALVFNNAGLQLPADFISGNVAELWNGAARELQVNLHAAILIAVGMLPMLRQQPEAAIVNITTGLVISPKRSSPAYCAAKAGLSAFTRSLRYQCEAGAPNVRIIEALPPMVDTDMTAGRGRNKMSARACAREIINGVLNDRPIIDIGKTKLLRLLMRISPALGYRVMRNV